MRDVSDDDDASAASDVAGVDVVLALVLHVVRLNNE